MSAPADYRVDWLDAHDGDAYAAEGKAVFGGTHAAGGKPAYVSHYPVRLIDGSRLCLPLTPLPGGGKAIALLVSNQIGFEIERRLTQRLAEVVHGVACEAVVGVPTLGLTYARPVAEALGFGYFVPLGHSRKFWYDDAFSEAAVSSTSPDQSKRLYLDPALIGRVRGQRVVIVDDVLNTGLTMSAAVRLLHKAQAIVVGIAAVLTEGWAWHRGLARIDTALPACVHALGHIPLFVRGEAGWTALPETDAGGRPPLE